MDQDDPLTPPTGDDPGQAAYQPPRVTYLGDLADLTRQAKEVGGADGSTFLGLDIGS
jgi:hypothetical protein